MTHSNNKVKETMKTIDRHQFKITVATAIVVILFMVITSYNYGVQTSVIEAEHKEFDDRIGHVGDKVIGIRADITALKEKASTRDIDIATINVKLTSIEALLLDIKTDLKTKT